MGEGRMKFIQASFSLEQQQGQGVGGRFVVGDSTALDWSALYDTVQMVYLDLPAFLETDVRFKVRIGTEGWLNDRPGHTLADESAAPILDRQAYVQWVKRLLMLAHSLLKNTGSVFVHTDPRMNAHVRLLLDEVFGQAQFVNEIVWRYQRGSQAKTHFSRRHDTIYLYGKSPDRYFSLDSVPQGKKRQKKNHLKRTVDERGRACRTLTVGDKTYTYYDDAPTFPDDVWDDVGTLAQKDIGRIGYPGEKSAALMERMVLSTTKRGDTVCDLLAGSGTLLACAAKLGRPFVGADVSPLAYMAARKRLGQTPCAYTASLETGGAAVSAQVMAGIGEYTVTLTDFSLEGRDIQGLQAVDQWAAGILRDGVFYAYEGWRRTKRTPEVALPAKVPQVRGKLAVLVVDIWGARHFFVQENEGASDLER